MFDKTKYNPVPSIPHSTRLEVGTEIWLGSGTRPLAGMKVTNYPYKRNTESTREPPSKGVHWVRLTDESDKLDGIR